ncbi:5-formyltetrahydrofolate cyclo-ligase [Mycena sanguinolenta]|uniref:5-formyltetrahydrofolate cyclo-ligase n=1 Tax=Mycena sanguinolenta TaxID=230812 RepID=A0A8H6Y2D0_9AGAR|nr:5-formyltetrahydrofolate cyclo-ligase [Mycena sanguinolenta]
MAAIALKAEKKLLRKAMTTTLRDLSASHIQEQSRALTARVLSLPSFIKSNSVSCYLSMPTGEIDTSFLVREILRSGKTFGVWGIKEPDRSHNGQLRASATDIGLDLILAPGLAFDRSLSRLGHGKGYYDRFITAYTENSRPAPLLVGLALREQLLDSNAVPIGTHDWKMDWIVTDQESIQ